jgi:hypothetical protein
MRIPVAGRVKRSSADGRATAAGGARRRGHTPGRARSGGQWPRMRVMCTRSGTQYFSAKPVGVYPICSIEARYFAR